MKRREAIGAMAAAALTAAFRWTPAEAARAAQAARSALKAPYAPSFFTAHEWDTVRVLVDIVIPRDDRSGSATDAGVPEFMDFMMNDRPDGQTPMRGGLEWLDGECFDRYGKTFLESSDTERTAVLDDIAWPKKARPEMSYGVAFFNRFRDRTASGFFSTAMGWQDVQYIGNTFNPNWNGCPSAALEKLGVSYDLMNTRVETSK
jgi:hypothetical protein